MDYCQCEVTDMERLQRARLEAWKYPETEHCRQCHKPIEPPDAKFPRPLTL